MCAVQNSGIVDQLRNFAYGRIKMIRYTRLAILSMEAVEASIDLAVEETAFPGRLLATMKAGRILEPARKLLRRT